MDLILFQNNMVSEVSFWSVFLDKFLSPFLVVVSAAYISWGYYKKKQKESIIRQDLENYYTILNFVMKNHEEFVALWRQRTQKVLEELNSAYSNLQKFKHLTNCYYDKDKLDLVIQVPDEKQYILEEFKKIESKIVLNSTFIQVFNSLIEKDFQRESTTLLLNGDIYFQKILLNFQQNCIQANRSISAINAEIKIDATQNRLKQTPLFILNATYEDNIKLQNDLEQKILYFNNLYDTLHRIIEVGLYNSINLFYHLNAFNHHYINKHSHILKSYNLYSPTYLVNSFLIDVEGLETIDGKYQEIHSSLWEIPLYKNLRRNLWDELESIFLYPKLRKIFKKSPK